jgi:hypothetical protein
LPAIEFPYIAKADKPFGGVVEAKAPQILKAAAMTLVVRAPFAWQPWAAGGGALAAAAGAAGAWWRRRKRAAAMSGAPGRTQREVVQALLHEARRHRLDGDFYAFYKTLQRAAQTLGLEEAGALAQRTQAVGYRGVRPTDDDMDGDIKRVELGLARTQEGSGQ